MKYTYYSCNSNPQKTDSLSGHYEVKNQSLK